MHEHLWINPTHFECWQKVYIQFTATAFHQNVTPGKSKYSIFFISLFFFKLTHQKFSFLHIKKTSCLCKSLIYRERGFLFWLHPGPNAWLQIKLPLSIIPLLWNLSFRFWMPSILFTCHTTDPQKTHPLSQCLADHLWRPWFVSISC